MALFHFPMPDGSVFIDPDRKVFKVSDSKLVRISGQHLADLLIASEEDVNPLFLPFWLAPGVSGLVQANHLMGVAMAFGSISFMAHPEIIGDVVSINGRDSENQVPFSWRPLCSDLPAEDRLFLMAAATLNLTGQLDFSLVLVHWHNETRRAVTYMLPMNNMFNDGRVCLGNFKPGVQTGVSLVDRLVDMLTRFSEAPMNNDLNPDSDVKRSLFRWDVNQNQIPFTLAELKGNTVIAINALTQLEGPLIADALAVNSPKYRQLFVDHLNLLSRCFLKDLPVVLADDKESEVPDDDATVSGNG